ncbi:MAG: pantothenate kinase type CoaX-like [Bacteriovoracaceae bacterium]|nr:pantothenate kinase type CoaX-like [Bacteriovoracaceae bacterium]
MSKSVWFLKIGNSRIIAWDGKRRFISSERVGFNSRLFLKKLSRIKAIYFFSVVPSISKEIQKECRLKKIECYEIKSSDIPVRAAYQKNIGIDRLMNVYAASLQTKKPLVVMDVGTALTVDFLSASRKHLGGWISAGPHLVSKALHGYTAKLPLVAPQRINKTFGKSTRESLQVGHRAFLHGMILEVRLVAKNIFGSSFEFFVTGGGAALISDKKTMKVDHLALKGLKQLQRSLKN